MDRAAGALRPHALRSPVPPSLPAGAGPAPTCTHTIPFTSPRLVALSPVGMAETVGHLPWDRAFPVLCPGSRLSPLPNPLLPLSTTNPKIPVKALKILFIPATKIFMSLFLL